jgi:hypothetical protein
MRSSATPSRSATTWASAVWWPWPCDGKLTSTRTVPSGSSLTVAASIPGTASMPRRLKISAPIPVYSV